MDDLLLFTLSKRSHIAKLEDLLQALLKCNKYKYVFAPGTLGILPDTYLVPVSHILGLAVRHINAI